MTTKTGFNTRAAKTYLDGKKLHRPLSQPIIQSTTFQAPSSNQLGSLFRDKADGVYLRFGHPTLTAVAEKVAELERGEAGLAFSSGMGAITTSLLTVLKPGCHVISQREIFAQTFTFFQRITRRFGVEIDFVDATDVNHLQKAIRPNTALVYVETPSNPLLKICDIEGTARLCRSKNISLFVDSTFASPFIQNPLDLGATLVLHSGTKFLGGHSDVMCGFAVGDATLIRQIKDTQMLLGNILDPHAAWLALRGIKSVGLRVQQQSDNALSIAQFLESRKEIRAINYPFLESSPQFATAKKQMRCGGGMISFAVEGGLAGARAFVDALQLIPVATSLGGVETTIEIPYDLDFSADELGDAAGDTGISPALIRLSVGIENVDDLIRDLETGAKAVSFHASKQGKKELAAFGNS